MAGYELQAWLLRTWRTEVARLTQSQVAKAVVTTKSVISMWENAERGITFDHLHALDRCYRAGGALADVGLAMGTPDGLLPRTSWVHNPQGGSGPVWAWCRPQSERQDITIQVRWGAFTMKNSSSCDDQGIFLTSPISMPNPPVWIDLAEPGWVDFGRGEIPAQLGIPTFDALPDLGIATGGHSAAGLVARDVVERFLTDEAFARAVLEFFGEPRGVVRTVFSTPDAPKALRNLANGAPPASHHRAFTGQQWRALRDCRCLSRARAARQATALLPDHEVTDDQIAELEKGGNPRTPLLRSRLDRVYDADGYTGIEEVKPRSWKPPFVFDFPAYWIGPIWFMFLSQNDTTTLAELRSGLASKQLHVKAGTTVTCRRPARDAAPFVVTCPRGWSVAAGVGMHAAAWDVNWGWSNVNDASSRGNAKVHELFLGLFGKSKEEFERFLCGLG